ncbi:2-oxoglutarate dehydrogenase E1 component [Rickettsiales endosymbiont of Stachyamoeba lipophora]|uniref:2-oxoglutarate dehydrogenase E1 component n=1 Tax=Rickettsiales endosymbiont of Stachyamoeba lipophora TaxID=2486578 RepID=UPI000F64FC92|nr:2-oxoglutarate dehydrogenase E1 component [Rickettsiales endosymbiont of Stachyamoeba lipophora]AZL15612.1 2-oxoglutarate dehydrogenase E1 component [Rickettsiales endosymbiont of Stachyamoeba lipophora]
MSLNDKNSYLFGSNAIYIEEIYQKYLTNPASVDLSWQEFFNSHQDKLEHVTKNVEGPSWHKRGVTVTKITEDVAPVTAQSKTVSNSEILYFKAILMIEAFRAKGHYLAELDPLQLEILPKAEDIGLNIENFGFKESDLNQEIDIKNFIPNITKVTVKDLVVFLNLVYCSYAGIEISHLRSKEERDWFYHKIETEVFSKHLTKELKQQIAKSLIEIEGFEQFLHVRFQGAKRFSVEGGETSVMAAEQIVEKSAELGIKRAIFGMAHRGRLNMLTKVLGKPYVAMLSEFQGNLPFPEEMDFLGDVKYHLGYSSIKKTTSGNEISVSMVPNPSHLEAVNPVVAGKVKSEQDLLVAQEGKDKHQARKEILPILLHGDAAFCGQGIVAESLIINEVEGYNVGGIIHIITNNQVGFTANPKDGRSSRYPSEFAKITAVPIIHVNGQHPELVAKLARLMVEYRQTFNKDVVMNLVCFRLYGHNENDEPFFTQPLMYEKISKKQGIVDSYTSKLINENIINQTFIEEAKTSFRNYLEKEFEVSKDYKPAKADWLSGKWSKCKQSTSKTIKVQPLTGVKEDILKAIGKGIVNVPESFNINSKIARQLNQKQQMFETGEGIDWATGEALAFSSLLLENYTVRLSGQDCGRGTFSHRHSVWHDQVNANKYMPFNKLSSSQGEYQVYDSPLSEFAVMGFEYGYALAHPDSLVLWEGQFGDFVNGAQVMIDQYIASAETKWFRQNGLVLLLPHGYEGQGPEHTSARLERFLQLCAEDNMAVCYPTTPASYFHLLRRQLKREFRKPLIIMSPKSLLRHKYAVSSLKDFSEGAKFKPVLEEQDNLEPSQVKKVVLCSGKIYYDLYEERLKLEKKDVALIRLEQLYPLPEQEIKEQLDKYKNAEVIWCQEEPKNMGAYQYIFGNLIDIFNLKVKYIGRKVAASPATGYTRIHNKEQAAILKQVFEN